jgi:hypothetical protein
MLAVSQLRKEFRYVTDKVIIRSETSADVSAIAKVTVAAFKTLAISNLERKMGTHPN